MTLATLTLRSVLRCIVLTLVLLTLAARAQITPGADAYTKNATSPANFGTKPCRALLHFVSSKFFESLNLTP